MVSLRVGVAVLIACAACGGANSGSQGNVMVSDGGGGSTMDGATMHAATTDGATTDASRIPQDARATDAGHPEAGPPGAGTDAALPATWTGIYQNLLVNQSYPSNCAGSSCHDPGTEKGIDLSTPEKGYTTISHRLVPGSPDSSELVTVLQSGSMPEKRPHMAAADVAVIRAWIQAGALDN
jgi:hypothetical protein